MAERPDHYSILGVPPGASHRQIRRAYHALAMEAHPDLVGDAGHETMLELNAAWEVLRDAQRRAAYDATISSARAAEAASLAEQERRSRQPPWTGAAGPPPGGPSGTRLDFGLYAGWTLGEIARFDHGYLLWLSERRESQPFAAELQALLERLRPRAPEPVRTRRRWSF